MSKTYLSVIERRFYKILYTLKPYAIITSNSIHHTLIHDDKDPNRKEPKNPITIIFQHRNLVGDSQLTRVATIEFNKESKEWLTNILQRHTRKHTRNWIESRLNREFQMKIDILFIKKKPVKRKRTLMSKLQRKNSLFDKFKSPEIIE